MSIGCEVHIWDDIAGYQKFNYKPYAYLKSQSGTYRSLYGDKLKKVTFWDKNDLENGRVFESDVPIETKILVDKYGDSDEPSEGHKELFFDIESTGLPKLTGPGKFSLLIVSKTPLTKSST